MPSALEKAQAYLRGERPFQRGASGSSPGTPATAAGGSYSVRGGSAPGTRSGSPYTSGLRASDVLSKNFGKGRGGMDLDASDDDDDELKDYLKNLSKKKVGDGPGDAAKSSSAPANSYVSASSAKSQLRPSASASTYLKKPTQTPEPISAAGTTSSTSLKAQKSFTSVKRTDSPSTTMVGGSSLELKRRSSLQNGLVDMAFDDKDESTVPIKEDDDEGMFVKGGSGSGLAVTGKSRFGDMETASDPSSATDDVSDSELAAFLGQTKRKPVAAGMSKSAESVSAERSGGAGGITSPAASYLKKPGLGSGSIAGLGVGPGTSPLLKHGTSSPLSSAILSSARGASNVAVSDASGFGGGVRSGGPPARSANASVPQRKEPIDLSDTDSSIGSDFETYLNRRSSVQRRAGEAPAAVGAAAAGGSAKSLAATTVAAPAAAAAPVKWEDQVPREWDGVDDDGDDDEFGTKERMSKASAKAEVPTIVPAVTPKAVTTPVTTVAAAVVTPSTARTPIASTTSIATTPAPLSVVAKVVPAPVIASKVSPPSDDEIEEDFEDYVEEDIIEEDLPDGKFAPSAKEDISGYEEDGTSARTTSSAPAREDEQSSLSRSSRVQKETDLGRPGENRHL
ncbi:hypothetical protein HK101_009937 [Irineochytrium annulatum]|nr:hypothetical protein HK101_009937 [Irineochytrium annulatum]